MEGEPPHRSRAWAIEKSVLGCFKLPSCYNCSRVDLELRARYPWVTDPRETRVEADEPVDVRSVTPAGSLTNSLHSSSFGSGSLSSAAQVMPKRLDPEDWPVRQPSFPGEGYPPVIFEVQAPIQTPPPVLDPTGRSSEIEECPTTPPIADAPPAAPSPTNDDSPRGPVYPHRYPRAIRTGRTWAESPNPPPGARHGTHSMNSARAGGEELGGRDGDGAHDHKAGLGLIEIGAGTAGGVPVVKAKSQTVEPGPGLLVSGPSDPSRFDPLYGANRKVPLPAKSVKLFIKHDRKPTWPHPAPPFEASTLYMTRRKNKHPNLQVQIRAEGPTRDGPSKWVSEVKRAEKNIRRTLAMEAGSEGGAPFRGQARGLGTVLEAQRVADAAEKVCVPSRKCESADVRRMCDCVDSTKSLHTLLAAMDVAAAVASSRCSKMGTQARLGSVQGPGARWQRSPEAPRREFDLARVLRARTPGPQSTVAFPQAQQNDRFS